jgi:Rrf2 family protein
MQLTAYTDYSLRVLMYLGLKGPRISSISEIAEQYGISRNHLVKVVHRLAQEGFVWSQRGRSGGIALGRPPQNIRVGDVVRRMEGEMSLVECFRSETNRCPITSVCQLKGVLAEARDHFLASLDRYTLADLLTHQQRLSRLFTIPAKPGERVRIYFVNAGPNEYSSFHPIAGIWDRVYASGNPKNLQQGLQTFVVGAGDAATFDLISPIEGANAIVTHSLRAAHSGAIAVLMFTKDADANMGHGEQILLR